MSNVQQDEKAVNPASRHFFFEAEVAYVQATKGILSLIKERWDQQQEQGKARDALKDIEARLIANGQVEGKNAEERTARLRVLLVDDPEAEAQREALAKTDVTLVELDTRSEMERSLQAMARYRLRYADATLRYLANIPPELPHESEA